MEHALSLNEIQSLCGMISYRRGEVYYNSNRVKRINYDPLLHRYDALVSGSKSYNVRLDFDDSNHVAAHCECPAYESYPNYCKHIAAVLLYIHDSPQAGILQPDTEPKQEIKRISQPVIPTRDMKLTNKLIEFFDRTMQENRDQRIRNDLEILNVEFLCKATHYNSNHHFFTIDMKLGTKRMYIVQKIKDFLTHVDRNNSYAFSKLFTFDPSIHGFDEMDWSIIKQLVKIVQNETVYREAFGTRSIDQILDTDRALYIPPMAWESLLPALLKAANVRFEYGFQEYDRMEVATDSIPLSFALTYASSDDYQLDILSMNRITVMQHYGCALYDGKLYEMSPVQLEQLDQLKDMSYYTADQKIRIAPAQIEPFMERVIPGLRKIGTVAIEQQIADRIANDPLVAKLYLDLDGDRLLAKLVYEYGDIHFDPFGLTKNTAIHTDRILIRDIEQENRMMNVFEQSRFKIHGDDLYMDDEDEIYDFLYYLLPELENLLDVYVSSPIQKMIQQDLYHPTISMDMNPKTDWLEIRFDIDGIDEQEIRNILRNVVEKKRYYRLPNGAYVSLESSQYHEIAQFMQEIGVRKSQLAGNRIELPVARGFHLLDLSESNQNMQIGRTLRQLLQNMKHPDNLEFPIPQHLESILRDYQKYGYQWMKMLAYYRFGGILADDMGLGKTLQSIAVIVSEQKEIETSHSPVLIVSPASLIYNWKNELKKFAPELQAVVISGNKQERQQLMSSSSDMDVWITSYPLLRRDLDQYANQSFHMLILDEAQAIKNHATQTTHAVKKIHAKYRFALTGTPIENSLEELWSIYDAIFPELFPTRKEFLQLSKESVAKRVRPFILRRLKSDVLKELPDKIETTQTSELSSEQKKLYVAYLSKLQRETMRDIQMDGFQKNRMKILAGLTRLRQLCCHPALFVDDYKGTSGKLEQLLEIIEECQGSSKRMLIFSQFTEMLSLIRKELDQRDISYFYLDGKTPPSERVELCEQFNAGDQAIFLISLKAGGTGLNLTGADTVILYDLWWNPAVEQQAADRAHRIGQKNVVHVIRLITEGTIEEKMYELQQKKKDLIDAVIEPGEQALTAFTEEEIREILMLES